MLRILKLVISKNRTILFLKKSLLLWRRSGYLWQQQLVVFLKKLALPLQYLVCSFPDTIILGNCFTEKFGTDLSIFQDTSSFISKVRGKYKILAWFRKRKMILPFSRNETGKTKVVYCSCSTHPKSHFYIVVRH